MPMRIADGADSRARIPRHLPDLTALQAHGNVLRPAAFIAGHDNGVGAGAPAEHGASVGGAAHAVHLCAQRHKVQRQAVAAESGLSREHAGVQHAAHAGQQVRRDAAAVALHYVAGAHALGRDDVAVLAVGLAL